MLLLPDRACNLAPAEAAVLQDEANLQDEGQIVDKLPMTPANPAPAKPPAVLQEVACVTTAAYLPH